VRLKVNFQIDCFLFKFISIPFGAIKSRTSSCRGTLPCRISIPFGAIKSHKKVNNKAAKQISIPFGAIKRIITWQRE